MKTEWKNRSPPSIKVPEDEPENLVLLKTRDEADDSYR